MKHRIAALFLAVVLCLSFVPTTYAAEATFEDSVDVEHLIDCAIEMYLTLEGHYDSVTTADSNALSIGFLQWHGNNAKTLLRMICQAAPEMSLEVLGVRFYDEIMGEINWKNRTLSSEECRKVKALISSDVGKQCQDTYARSFILDEAKVGWKRGVRTEPALLYYCSIENQFGIGGAANVMRYLRETMEQNMGMDYNRPIDSLELFHTVWLTAAETGRYPNSISKYQRARVKVYNFLTGNLGINPGPYENPTPFEDLPYEGHWAREAIVWAYSHEPQITSGTSETTFSPYSTVTRGQAMTFLWVAAGKPQPTSYEHPFTDVDEDDYYYVPVLWAVENRVTAGTTATTFSPKDPVTREQMLTFLWAAAGREEVSGVENPFTDVKEGRYYYQPVLWALSHDMLVGNEGGRIDNLLLPKAACFRAYVVTYLYNLFRES